MSGAGHTPGQIKELLTVIEQSLMGVDPCDQDVTLEDSDWELIRVALHALLKGGAA